MVEIPDSLRSLFSATVIERDDSFLIELPRSEVEHDAVRPGETYRVAVLPTAGRASASSTSSTSQDERRTDRRDRPASQHEPDRAPPVEEGEVREVTIETTGDQGDGIAKVDRGYVVIVPDGEPGETLTVEIDTVRPNVAFAHVVEGERRS